MSTIKRLSVKAVKPQDQTSVSKAQALIEATLADQTTELSKAIDDSIVDSLVYGTGMLKIGGYTVSTSNTTGAKLSTYPRPIDLKREMLEVHPAFELTVEQLRAAWMLAYGNRWVSLDDATQDDYMEKVTLRLKALGELEVHNIVDQYAPMARIKL